MQKITIIVLLLFSITYPSLAQNTSHLPSDSSTSFLMPPYKLAVGIRFPLAGSFIDPGVSAKYFTGKKITLEVSIGWNIAWQDLTVTLFATRNHRLFRKNNLRVFYGAGLSGVSTEANMRTQQRDNKEHFYVGAGITAGLEYPLRKKPFIFGAEYRQVYYRFAGQDINSKYFINSTFGITARYIIK